MTDWLTGLNPNLQTTFWIITVGAMTNTACALVGCYLVLRRMSMLGDALSHAVLPGLVVAFILSGSLGIATMFVGALAAGILTAVLVQWLHRGAGVPEDASMGVVFTALFALGVVLIKRYASAVDLEVSDGDLASACDTTVTIEDTTPPNITAPDDILLECTGPDGMPVDLGTPSVSDICDPTLSVGNDAPALFPLGVTVVTWTASDDSGNSTNDTQVVTIVDTTPPDLSLSLDPDSLWPPNHMLHTIDAVIEVTDICDSDPRSNWSRS